MFFYFNYLQGFALNEVHTVQHPTSFTTEGSARGIDIKEAKELHF